MENTTENKLKFIANYWNQKVGITKYSNRLEINKSNIYNVEYLLLKPISSITDEEILEYKNFQKMQQMDDHYFIANYKEYLKTGNFSSFFVDYFRSKGFAIEWMGLSVEEMIDFGWIKLKSE